MSARLAQAIPFAAGTWIALMGALITPVIADRIEKYLLVHLKGKEPCYYFLSPSYISQYVGFGVDAVSAPLSGFAFIVGVSLLFWDNSSLAVIVGSLFLLTLIGAWLYVVFRFDPVKVVTKYSIVMGQVHVTFATVCMIVLNVLTAVLVVAGILGN